MILAQFFIQLEHLKTQDIYTVVAKQITEIIHWYCANSLPHFSIIEGYAFNQFLHYPFQQLINHTYIASPHFSDAIKPRLDQEYGQRYSE